jgi:hypothetical protein
MNGDGVNQLPVIADNCVVGRLSYVDVITLLRATQELAAQQRCCDIKKQAPNEYECSNSSQLARHCSHLP